MEKTKRVLVTPLDWGLGHATRSIPVIRALLNRGADVYVGSSGLAMSLLKTEFPGLTFIELPSYHVRYSTSIPLSLKILSQLPKFIFAVQRERRIVRKIIDEHGITHIISDNRYGCWSLSVPSFLITHQCTILMPRHLKWLERIVNTFNHRQIRKFDECWVPDNPPGSLTGALSQAAGLKRKYIGMLSRFNHRASTYKFDLLVLISGPEPQRTAFEQLVLFELPKLEYSVMIVRGLPDARDEMRINFLGISVVNHLSSSELENVILESEVVLCRSGYSTIMDLIALQKKAIFIPTPGQTEQEYLAYELDQRRVALSLRQGNVDLIAAMKKSKNYQGFEGWTIRNDLLSEILDDTIFK